MHYIKQLLEGKPQEWVHLLFTRYGRGQFDGPTCEVDVGKDIKFKGTVEYSTLFGELVTSCGGDYKVDGTIFAKIDFRDELSKAGIEFDDKSKPKQGFYVAQVKGEFPGSVLAGVYSKLPHATVLLNLAGEKGKLKCKKKPPKPGGEKDLDFFSGSMGLSAVPRLKEEVFFDAGDFKKVKVENKFAISELLIPSGMGAAEARLNAKRKGKVLRKVTLDGTSKESEFQFAV
jgi:hypothetical protein